MNSDDFEKKLERQPMRAVPAEWRAQILHEATAEVSDLRKAGQASCLSVVANKDRTGETPVLLSKRRSETAATAWWRELFWPHPLAWASLAAAWMLIAILHAATPAATMLAAQPTTSSSAVIRQFAEQRRELAALLDSPAETEAPRTSKPSQPRSQLTMPPANACNRNSLERTIS